MNSWPDILKATNESPDPQVLVTVGAARGSTPRNTGTKMRVSANAVQGTIGGGQLEFVVIQKARDMLENPNSNAHELMQLPLGPELAQCCGGYTEIMLERLDAPALNWIKNVPVDDTADGPAAYVVICHWSKDTVRRELIKWPLSGAPISSELIPLIQDAHEFGTAQIVESEKYSGHFTLIEPLVRKDFQLVIFGAGHVGRAIVHTLSPLPCQILWVDERAEEFPDIVASNVSRKIVSDPKAMVHKAVKGSYFLVMTHSHKRDQELVTEILQRGDSAYLGLIGSQTKRARFFSRLRSRGFSDADLGQITCPIGVVGTGGKHPTEIAISVAAEILQVQARRQQVPKQITGVTGINIAQSGH